MGPHVRMAEACKKVTGKKEQPPREPISLRIAYTEEHQWKLVDSHLTVCPGNGCGVEMCLYIRELIAHDTEDCDSDCEWCNKIIRWLRVHKNTCAPKRCPYYFSCSEVQKKMVRVSMRRHSDPRLTATTGIPSPNTVTFDERKPVKIVPSNDIDDDSCCRDPIESPLDDCINDKLLNGTFTDVYQKAIQEELPESELMIKNNIDYKLSMRQALISQLNDDKGYQEGRHWRRIRQIGSGGSGKAFCIEDVDSELCLALKEEPDSDEAVREVCVSFHVSSVYKDHPPNIVEFYGAALLPVLNSTKMQLFLELMPCCLQSYLYNGGPLSVENCHNYACQLFEALDFLHQKINIVHADIKPGNLLVDENIQRIKVADFGCSQILEDYHHQAYCMRGDPNAGTIHYNPPEHYTERRCGYSLDIWQAGCCLIAMVTGRRPWRALYPDCKDPNKELRIGFCKFQVQKISEACESGKSYLIPGFLDGAMTHLLHNCLNPDYRKRPSPQQCLSLLVRSDIVSKEIQHRWLRQLGSSPSPPFPISNQSLPHSSSSPSDIITDVYLGSYLKNPSPVYCLLPGWLGSFPCGKGTTYEQLVRHYMPYHIPIIASFPQYFLKLCQNIPYQIWEKSKLDDPVPLRTITSQSILNLETPSDTDTVDPSFAVVLIIS